MVYRTEGIVLESAPQGETSRRVVLYTQGRGRLSAVAKGARLVRSQFGSSLQPLSHVQAVLFCRTPHSLHILKECTVLRSLQHLANDLNKLAIGLRICELTRHLTESEDPDLSLYDLLLSALQAINDSSGTEEQVLLYFQLKLASLLGFAPAFTKQAVQDLPDNGGYLRYEGGSIVAEHPGSGSSVWASRTVLRAFAVLARADIDVALTWPITEGDLREVRRLTENFLRYHVSDAYPTRGATILRALFDGKKPAGIDASAAGEVTKEQ